jgi:outer membrane protein, heavy metal efflux system
MLTMNARPVTRSWPIGVWTLLPLFGPFACGPIAVASLPEPRPLGRDLPAFEAPALGLDRSADFQGAAHPANLEPAGALPLREALRLALERNPELAAFSWEVRASEARTLQEGLLPNPELAVEVEDFGGSGEVRETRAAQTTLQLAQLVEVGGKRAKRARVAALEQRLAGWDYEAHRIEVLTAVTRAFLAVLAAQERLALSEQLQGLAETALDMVTSQIREGAASRVERTRAQVTLSSARVDREQKAAELEVARARLAELWGSDTPAFSEVTGDLTMFPAPHPLAELEARVEQNPDLARWNEEIERRRAAVELADSLRLPNVSVGPGVRWLNETNDYGFVFGLGIPLPVFDRNQGERLAARSELGRGREEQRAAEARVRTALRTAHRQLMAAYQRVTALRDETLPSAEEAYQQSLDAYHRGLFRYLEVLDAQRTLFDLRDGYIGALEDYHSAIAELEGLTGEAL